MRNDRVAEGCPETQNDRLRDGAVLAADDGVLAVSREEGKDSGSGGRVGTAKIRFELGCLPEGVLGELVRLRP